MREEQEIMSLITNFAINNGSIRAVIMNGSRVNKNVQKDIMQDYDIIYVVTSTLQFIEDKSWINYFGRVCIMQEPDNSKLFKVDTDRSDSYTFLVQFKDGVRIDFSFKSIPTVLNTIYDDKLAKVILDKDKILPSISEATDEDYILKKPTKDDFRGCCNEFWWVSVYIAKGLYRDELLYAMDHFNFYVRKMLLLMLAYKAGFNNNYSLSFGKNYKYLPNYMSENDYERLKNTYTILDKDNMWKALDSMLDFFKDLSNEVGKLLGYSVNIEEIENTMKYIEKINNNDF